MLLLRTAGPSAARLRRFVQDDNREGGSFCVGANPFHDAADSHTGGAFSGPGLGFVEPGETGYIEMEPRGILGELLEEHGCGDGSAVAATGVLDVGDVGADLLAIFVFERQAPEAFPGAGQRVGEVLEGFVPERAVYRQAQNRGLALTEALDLDSPGPLNHLIVGLLTKVAAHPV